MSDFYYKENRSLHTQLQDKIVEAQELTIEVKALQELIDTKDIKISRLKTNLKQSVQAHSSSVGENRYLQEHIFKLQKEQEKFLEDYEAFLEKIETLVAKNTEKDTEIEDLKQTVGKLTEELEYVKENQLVELKGSLDDSRLELDHMNSQIKDIESSRRKAEEETDKLKSQRIELLNSITEKNKEIESFQKSYELSLMEIERLEQKARVEGQEKTSQMSQLEDIIDKAREEIEVSQGHLVQNKLQIDDLKGKVVSMQGIITEQEKIIRTREDNLVDMEKEVKKKEKDLDDSLEAYKILEEKLTKNNYEELEFEYAKFRKEVKKGVKDRDTKIIALSKQLKEVTKEFADYRSAADGVEGAYKELQTHIDAQNKTIEELSKRITESMSHINALEKEKEDAFVKLQHYAERDKELQGYFERKEKMLELRGQLEKELKNV